MSAFDFSNSGFIILFVKKAGLLIPAFANRHDIVMNCKMPTTMKVLSIPKRKHYRS
jgi:hypothetical protein